MTRHAFFTSCVLDIVGAIFAFFSTVFYVKVDKWAWLLGGCCHCCRCCFVWPDGDYGDMTLTGIYFLSMFYGWYQWTRLSEEIKTLPHCTSFRTVNCYFNGAFDWRDFRYSTAVKTLYRFTDSLSRRTITTVLSLVAQWMICKKIIETWFLWFVVNVIYVGLYFYKGIQAHGILLMIYLGMAVAGYLRWRGLMQTQAPVVFKFKPS